MTLVWMNAKMSEEIKEMIKAFGNASFKSVFINELNKEILSKEAIFLFFPEKVNPEEVANEGFDFPYLRQHVSMNYERDFEKVEEVMLEVITFLKQQITKETSFETLIETLKGIGFKELENKKLEPSEASISHLLALTSLMSNEKEKADNYFNEALELYENHMMGENEDALIHFYHNLSLFYKLENKKEEAIEFMRIESLFLGPKQNKTEKELEHLFQIEFEIAKYYLKKEKIEKLEDMIQMSLLSGEKVRTNEELVELYEDFLEFYHKKAHFFHEQRNYDKAITFYLSERKLIDIIPFEEEEKIRKISHWDMLFAPIFVVKEEYEKAEYYYLNSIELREKLIFISKDEYQLSLEYSYECLMNFYRRIGDFEKLEQIKSKYEALRGGNK